MVWQIFLALYLLFTTIAYCLRRVLAQRFTDQQHLVNVVFFVGFLYPLGLIVAYFTPHNLAVGSTNMLLLFLGSMIFPIFNLMAYKANRSLDVGFYSVLTNLQPVIVIAGATLLLHEGLHKQQLLGAVLLIGSAIAVGLPNVDLKKVSKAHADAVWLAICAVALLGIGILFERYMLKQIDFGAYIVFGWGFQTLWAVIIAVFKGGLNLKKLLDKKTALPIAVYGLSNTLKSIFFIATLQLSHNASVVISAASFSAVLVVFAAYLFMNEKEAIGLKLGTAAVSVVGLLLL